jgi:acetolactate synthase-1/2/3 large subunit
MRFGRERQNQILAYQRLGEEWFSYHHSDASDLGPVDHAAIARACGCFGERVDTPDQFGPALDRALASGLPAVLDVMTDPEAMPPLTHYLFRPPPPAAG